MKGWYRDSYRHSLAAKGIRTSFVANSLKGWRSRPEDLVWSQEHNRFVDWRKIAAAKGLKTGNKRKTLRKGDTLDMPYGMNIYEGQVEAERQPAFTEFSAMPKQMTLPVVPPIVQEYRAPLGSLSEQQAQPVEDGLPEREVSSPQFLTADNLPPLEDIEGTLIGIPKITMAAKHKGLYDFVRENRVEIDRAIRSRVPSAKIDDEERRLWILNDEGLYNWAKSEGVRI